MFYKTAIKDATMQTRAFSWLELCQSINQHDESSLEYSADNSTINGMLKATFV